MTQDFSSVVGGLAPGEQIAGYQVQEQIGRGGMAVVYRALDLRLGRPVALKVLAPHLGEDEAFRQRFMRESRAAAGVDHPHIIPVFEAGEADGVLFIAMRYVSYGDVRMLIDREGRLSAARTAAITAQVASALDAAHARGLVHRDVKPGNILLAEAGGAGQDHVYLSDFGLSKHSLAASTLTATGQFMGTLDYVSPEQIQGHPADGRADQYALACTAVEMLSGSPPFRRDESMALLWAQLEAPPPPLTDRCPELPRAVDSVIRTALAKSPADRYPTCMAFAAALRAACEADLTSRPVPAPAAPAVGVDRLVPLTRQEWPPAPAPTSAPRTPTEQAAALGQALRDGSGEVTGSPITDRLGAGRRPPGPAAYQPGNLRPARQAGPGRRSRRWLPSLLIAIAVVAVLGAFGYRVMHHHTTSPPAPSATTGATATTSGPAITVKKYFAAINQHRYRRAWDLGGKDQNQSYQQFVAGFTGTARDVVRVLSVSGNVVTADLTALQTSGLAKHYRGTYTVSGGMIISSNILQVSS
jgi:Protein kinase domain